MSTARLVSDAGGVAVSVTGGELVDAANTALATASKDGVAAKLLAKDATLWGPDAEDESKKRLGWLDLPTSSRQYLPELAQLKAELDAQGVNHVVLAGMGGSSLAPEVIAATAGVSMTILDTTDAGQIRAALQDRLADTVVVVSSKSGGTLETDSHRRTYEHAFAEAGIDPRGRIVVVTDPGSPLEQIARDAGYRTFLADPDVGGRYSALSAFGVVPSFLAGVDVAGLLTDAEGLLPTLGRDSDNPALALGAALGAAGLEGRDKVIIADFSSGHPGFGDWAEQLIAESTGKLGTGLLPVVVEGVDAPDFSEFADRHLVTLGAELKIDGTTVSGSLGAQFLAWEYATAVAGRVLGINPFDQPNVQESKEPLLLAGAKDLAGVMTALLHAVPERGYLAVMAYLDRHADSPALLLRKTLAARTERPVTFGWAPRFLHSTGQFHKGGPQVGAFLQITGVVENDLAIPGRPFGFARLQLAQALGDLGALQQRGRPVIRLHLRNRTVGLQELLAAANAR
jgi:glucose-6-phosphate isomerase